MLFVLLVSGLLNDLRLAKCGNKIQKIFEVVNMLEPFNSGVFLLETI